MRRTIPFAALLMMVATTAVLRAVQTSKKPPQAGPQKFVLPNGPGAVGFGVIEKIGDDATIRVHLSSAFGRLPEAPSLTEGYYLGFVGAKIRMAANSKMVRLRVREILKGAAVIEVSKTAAGKIKAGEFLVMFRPVGSLTRDLRQAPDIVPVVDASNEITGITSSQAANLVHSKNNLKQIGLALHNYHDVHRHFPPAVVYGPDGKPWHSWRVLILPYIEEAALYSKYRFDEPWNGPNNKKLISKMPKVFRDPVYTDEEDEGNYTHYAAVTGKGTAFPTEGVKSDGRGRDVHKRGPGSMRIRDFIDGTSNSVIVGSVGPERGIEWTKPEDVVVKDKFPGIGKNGGFAAPYKSKKGNAGMFLRCDGSVTTIVGTIDKALLRKLLIIADGQPIIDDVPTIDPTRTPRGKRRQTVVSIVKGRNGLVAKMQVEFVDRPAGIRGLEKTRIRRFAPPAKTAAPSRRAPVRPKKR